jgi:[acyl-carrier-protein] S-malonyltransferase
MKEAIMRVGVLFAGQGAQYPGMGKSLYENSDVAKKVFDEAGNRIKEWCFEGEKETLKLTHVTQPSVYTVTMAAYSAFLEEVSKLNIPIEIVGVAGFSLGEYSALTAAGVIENPKQGLNIVIQRGELMLKAGLDDEGNQRGGMSAAVGRREDILKCVAEAREDSILEGVNFNSKMQTVVAGDKEALARFKQVATENRIKVIPLNVSTAFHSPMMESAIEPIRQVLLKSDLKSPKIKVYCNVTGDDMFEGKNISNGNVKEYVADTMARQANSPIYWQETIENMVRDGIDVFVEVGPGTVLSGLARKTVSNITTLNIEDKESLDETIKALTEMTAV